MSKEQIGNNKKKKKKKRLLFRSIVLAVLLVALVYALVSNLSQEDTNVDVGDQAPDFELKQVNKNNELETVKLSDLKGKGVMLNFWATYCPPCEAEMPYMEKLYPEYKEKGVEIVAVSLDSTELVINRFIEKYNLTFPTPHDKSGQVMEQYGVGPIPSTFFINPEGEIVEVVSGALTLEKLEGYLKQIQPE
ncbi:thiol-disulfide oxidoreductase ResA [Virgibacillus oceani]|uniref:Thiol-disulfide oxidoreductase ResA n=1 Tax=Virgibacillus oceani TaxID=1479511 RepID=A0A917H223_9BACI|nr:thiol-disulfide oxidoreductase ResA [Virgibacillus oceani]GGG64932.1 thiol-disulfide oxidoreductase ResA [Virgibacillus oceani]